LITYFRYTPRIKLSNAWELPPQQEGLGVMHVATAEELKQFADDDHLWADASYEAMKAAEVLFIPK